MNKKLILGLVALMILVAATLSGCNAKKPALPAKEVPTNIDKKPVKNVVKDTASVPFAQLKYKIASIPSNTKIELNTPWEGSPSGELKATIEGKGENAKEEGYSHIIIKDKKSGKLTKLTLENEEKSVLTAKDLEWMDESNLFVILGQPFGTVSKGGKIYKVNIITGETTLYKDIANSREEFTAVHKSVSGFTFEKYVYDDDNFIKGHIESGNLELK
jgi:hypothetical protein